jgi:hypothetical protein
MSFKAPMPASGGDFAPTPAGNFVGRCYSLIDLGTQITKSGEFAGKANHKIRIGFELFGETEDGTPMSINIDGKEMPLSIFKEYTLSMHEKSTLRKELGAWRGKQFADDEEAVNFDITKLVGAYAMVNIAHRTNDKGKVNANIANLSPLPSALKNAKPAPRNANVIFSLDEPNMDLFNSFSEWLQGRISEAPEWNKKTGKSNPLNLDSEPDPVDDNAPF